MMRAIVLLGVLTFPAFAGEAPQHVVDPAPAQLEEPPKDTVDEGQVPLDDPNCCNAESYEISYDSGYEYYYEGGYE